jgi:hypothetical protein
MDNNNNGQMQQPVAVALGTEEQTDGGPQQSKAQGTTSNTEPKTAKQLAPLKTAEAIQKMALPTKEALVQRALYRGDFVTVAGRRRHGKTTLLTQLAVCLTGDLGGDFLGYRIPKRRRVLMYLLEDTFRDSQRRLWRMFPDDVGTTEGRLCIRTKDDFLSVDIPIDITDRRFRDAIEKDITEFRPDVVMFDHLGLLVTSDVNDTQRMHKLITFATTATAKYDCAIMVAAHPRKRPQDGRNVPSLERDRDLFFEEVMGLSTFINATGSLWGIERKTDNYGLVYIGAQREGFDGELVTVEKDDDDWFRVADDFEANFDHVVATDKRKKAWALLPNIPFTAEGARVAVKTALSGGAFYAFWSALKQARLIRPVDEKRFAKAAPGKSGDTG